MLLTCNIKRIKGAVHKIGDFDGTYKRGFFWEMVGGMVRGKVWGRVRGNFSTITPNLKF